MRVCERIEKEGWTDPVIVKERQSVGFKAVKALHQRVQASFGN